MSGDVAIFVAGQGVDVGLGVSLAHRLVDVLGCRKGRHEHGSRHHAFPRQLRSAIDARRVVLDAHVPRIYRRDHGRQINPLAQDFPHSNKGLAVSVGIASYRCFSFVRKENIRQAGSVQNPLNIPTLGLRAVTKQAVSTDIYAGCTDRLTHITSTPASPLKTHPAARLSSVSPSRAATPFSSQRRISRADTAPRLNAAMSQSLDARQDLIGQCQSRRSWGDVQPAKLSRESAHTWIRARLCAVMACTRTSYGTPARVGRMVLQRQAADLFARPAHGEQPVVNGKAGVLSASGSTPPSSPISCSKDSSGSLTTLVRTQAERVAG